MPPIHRYALLLLCGGLLTVPATADDIVIFHGKVTLEDGSPPGHLINIQRNCEGAVQPMIEGSAATKTGEYIVRLHVNDFGQVQGSMGMADTFSMLTCVLEASEKGFVSSRIDLSDRAILRNPRLPDIVLTPSSKTALTISPHVSVPHAASRNWDTAVKQLTARNWTAAETPLRAAVDAAPAFAPGWLALGTLYTNLGKMEDSCKALQHAIELDPKPLPPYIWLARAQIEIKDWPAAAATTQLLIGRDTKHSYVEAYLLSAVALYQMHDLDRAMAAIGDAIRLDKAHELPRAEYVLGLVFEAKGDYPAAGEHMRTYVQQHPRAKDVAQANDRIANLGKAPPADLSKELTPLDLQAAGTGEAPVPGGIKAFSKVAQLKSVPSYEDFFLEYCRALTAGGPMASTPTKEAGEEVKTFIGTVAALETAGERQPNGTLIRLSVTSDESVRKTRAILAELGWKLLAKGDSYAIEPGDRPGEGSRQWALAALGVDELDLREAIRDKREFTFEIPHENARLVGGPGWGVVLKGVPDMPGGPIEAFTRDWRFARVYSALGAMDSDTAAAVVSAMSLSNQIVKYSTLMADYGEAVTMTDKHVAVPGGPKAQQVWEKLAGASPRTPTPFLRALFDKDQGRLLAFYFDLTHADAAHQRYFTESTERAEAYYKWYRESAPPSGLQRTPQRWQAKILQSLRLDESGKIVFPGGLKAWGTASPAPTVILDATGRPIAPRVPGAPQGDDRVLLQSPALEAMAAIIELEEKRGAPLSTDAVRILADRYKIWNNLFPYFEKLPNLDAADFNALAAFSDEVAKAPAARRNMLVGEWHSLVELIVLGAQAGSLNPGRSAEAFRQACEAMRSSNPPANAIAMVRAMMGGMVGVTGDLDDALAGQLLRLNGARREAFENVKKLQGVPRLSSLGDPPDAAKTLAALSGAVYAAVLDPAYLLVAEDPQLLSKHSFLSAGSGLFMRSSLVISSDAPGTNFEGGFARFPDVARELRQRTVGDLLPEALAGPAPAPAPFVPSGSEPAPADGPSPAPGGDLVFHAGGRVVEVYATVTDSRGRYVDDLTAGQFSVHEEGQTKPVFAFENHTAAVSVVLLFDTTGSMVDALPPLKSAAMQLVDDLRPTDSVSVYSFADRVTELQPFTSDKEAAKRAILKTHAEGVTALYDALVRVNHDLAGRPGKKVVIVFTDGDDNSSMLTPNTAIDRAKARGIPIYTIAEGEALLHPKLLAELNNISQSTGGTQFKIRQLSDIGPVFEKVSQDLLHGYLVAFQPSPGDNDRIWRKIELVLSGPKGLQVRARDGFYVE